MVPSSPFGVGNTAGDETELFEDRYGNEHGHKQCIDRTREAESNVILEENVSTIVRHHDNHSVQGEDRCRMANGGKSEIGKEQQGQQRKNAPQQIQPMVRFANTAVQPNVMVILLLNAAGANLAVISSWGYVLAAQLACQPAAIATDASTIIRIIPIGYKYSRLRVVSIFATIHTTGGSVRGVRRDVAQRSSSICFEQKDEGKTQQSYEGDILLR